MASAPMAPRQGQGDCGMGSTPEMAGLLTCGSMLLRTFPGISQWHMSKPLTAYSCGGSRGIGLSPAPRSLFSRPRKVGTITADSDMLSAQCLSV